MKKKTLALLIIAILLLSLIPQTALASASVTTDKTSAQPGETVSISGTASADESVVVKITDNAGNIVFFDAAKADTSGKYTVSFVVPKNTAAGKLTVTAGSGSDVATTTMTVKTAPQATPEPTTTPSSSSSAQPTAGPSTTPAPAASEDKPVPSNTDEKVIVQTGDSGSGWMIAVYIAAGLLVLAAAVWILLHRRNRQKLDDR